MMRIVAWMGFVGLTAAAVCADEKLDRQGRAFLEQYCHRCHGVQLRYPGLDVLDRASLVLPRDKDEPAFVAPGNPGASRLWEVIASGEMPPEKQPQPSAAEKAAFRQWIEAGAEFPAADRPHRPFLGEDTLLAAIAADLLGLDKRDRPFTRYFSLIHLWNQPDFGDDLLRLQRAGLSKLLNSLSYRKQITRPRVVENTGQTLLAIDLRNFGWTAAWWEKVLREYPYGLQRGGDEAQHVYDLTGCDIPHVRADWFVYQAARPPLYHVLLNLPEHAQVLERDLGVNVRRNFETDQMLRAGMTGKISGVSEQNRVIDRHDTPHGAYYKSNDFKSDKDLGNIFRNPLGPVFPGVKGLAAYVHDGGEIIWNLPNGLQAYLLVDGKDARIDAGPIEVVSDPNQHSGSFAIVNGISCMGCHHQGLIDFEDAVRPLYLNRRGQPVADKVLKLFVEPARFRETLDADRGLFLRAVEAATLSFLRPSGDDPRGVKDFPEPISTASKRYQQTVSLSRVAYELGLPLTKAEAEQRRLPLADDLVPLLKFNTKLRRLNLTELTTGQEVARETWERAYQTLARELGLGIPVNVR